MRVAPLADGFFGVFDDAGKLIQGDLCSNADAWRWIDDRDEDAIRMDEKRDRISKAVGQW